MAESLNQVLRKVRLPLQSGGSIMLNVMALFDFTEAAKAMTRMRPPIRTEENTMIKQIKRPDTFEWDEITYKAKPHKYDEFAICEAPRRKYGLYVTMPHDAFDALVEAIITEFETYLLKTEGRESNSIIKKGERLYTTLNLFQAATSIAARGDESPWKIEVVENKENQC